MSAIQIFEDAGCTRVAGQMLFEGRTYFVSFPTIDPDVISSELLRAGLVEFTDWHPHNKIAALKIINRVGLLRFFGKVFDVRSEKLLDGFEGRRQFEIILNDLTRISREIVFDYSATTSAHRTSDQEILNASLLERFNYYRQFVLDMPGHSSMNSLVEAILRNPHSQIVSERFNDYLWNVKRPTQRTIESIFTRQHSVQELSSAHPLVRAALPRIHSSDGTRNFLPLRASNVRSTLSFDTMENRFVKHILLDIENVCVATQIACKNSRNVFDACGAMLLQVRAFLRREFFAQMTPLTVLSTSSPTLTSRHGYKELYGHFLKSRTGAKHIFHDLEQQSLYIDLKDIALLYEYWVFYKVARSLLGEKAIVLARSSIMRNGSLLQSIELADGKISVAYNKSFTRKSGGSYSLNFRPDIVVSIRNASQLITVVFDAKYKYQKKEFYEDEFVGPQEISRAVKAVDLHKMHCYVDAIEKVGCAMAIYPGTDFVFFPRDSSAPVARHASELTSSEGIGSIPLLPGLDGSQIEFDQTMRAIKKLAIDDTAEVKFNSNTE